MEITLCINADEEMLTGDGAWEGGGARRTSVLLSIRHKNLIIRSRVDDGESVLC